jgi:hypothetical protein
MSDLIVDRETVHEALKGTGGRFEEAFDLLKNAGVKLKNLKQLNEYIIKDPVLSVVWSEGFTYDKAAGAIVKADISEEKLTIQKLQAEENYIAAKGLEKTGLEASEIKEVVALSNFSADSFAGTMDMLHGMMTVSAFKLHKRAEKIEKEVLDNDEEDERVHVTAEGDLVKYVGPKYTEEEKMQWLDRWIDIKDKLRRIAETAHTSGKIRADAKRASDGDIGAGGNTNRQRPKKLPADGSIPV